MATTVQSLFGLTPEDLQAQQDSALNEQAYQYAKMDPMQAAQMGFFRAGSQLGSGVAGLMGYENPQMKRLKQRQGLLGGLDINDPTALKQAAQRLQQAGDMAGAQELYNMAAQRETASLTTRKTEAEIASKLTEKLTNEQKNAAGWADTFAVRGTPEWTKAYSDKLRDLTTKEGSKISYGNEAEIVSRALYGKNFNELSQQEAAEVQKKLEIMGVTKAKASGVNISNVVSNKAAEQFGSKFGQLTGEQAAQIEGKYGAIDYIREARNMLDEGIYAGQWGPEQLAAAKASRFLVGDKQKAERTEQFIAYIGNTVIPRLQEFGGNDSVEELNYLKGVQGGNIRLEPKSIGAILTRAERAIQRGIDRTRRSVTAVGGENIAPTDAGALRAQPTPTKRWNPETKKLEEVR